MYTAKQGLRMKPAILFQSFQLCIRASYHIACDCRSKYTQQIEKGVEICADARARPLEKNAAGCRMPPDVDLSSPNLARPLSANFNFKLRSKIQIDLDSVWMGRTKQYNNCEGEARRRIDEKMYRSFDQDAWSDVQGSGKRTGFGVASTAPRQPILAGMPYREHPFQPDLYPQSTKYQEIAFNVVNEMSQQVYAAEIPQYAELMYGPDLQPMSAYWGLEQAPPLLRRGHAGKQEPAPESRNWSNRERASRPSDPDIRIRAVPVEKIVEVVKNHYIFKEVPVERVTPHKNIFLFFLVRST